FNNGGSSMKKGLLFLGVFLLSTVSYGNTLTGLLGFAQGAFNVGANFQARGSSAMNFGGYFHLSTEKADDNKANRIDNHQTMSFGGLAFMNLGDTSDMTVYIAPGAGITTVKGIKNAVIKDDQTIIGPIWKIGAFMRLSYGMKIGLEQTQIVNWFTDKVYPTATYTNVGLIF